MAENEDGQERTEQPTERKLEKLREQAEVPRSKELTSASVLCLLIVMGTILFPHIYHPLLNMTRYCFHFTNTEAGDSNWMFIKMLPSQSLFLTIFLTVFLISFIASFFSSVSMGGLIFSGKALKFNLNRINPVNGLKKIFSAQSLIELLKSIIKLLFITAIFWFCLYNYHRSLINLSREDINQALSEGIRILGHIILSGAAGYLFISLFDIPLQLYLFNKKAMMTKQEVKDSHKDEEISSELKRRIRQIQQETSNRRMLEKIPDADVIITNPTHFAVALSYNEKINDSPVVIAQGADHMAALIISLGKKHHRPIMMHPLLARALYHNTKPGDNIPLDLYLSVAQILAYIRQLSDFNTGTRTERPETPVIEIPEHYRKNL